MYAKVFSSLWKGSLRGQSDAQHVFIYLLAHADEYGTVEAMPQAISDETGLDLSSVRGAITHLESVDPESRTADREGRRIERLDEHRSWSWIITNYERYRQLCDREKVREQTRERVRNHRRRNVGLVAGEQPCAYCGIPTTGSDHIVPLARGGVDGPENCVPCCLPCNMAKSSRPVLDFLNDKCPAVTVSIEAVMRYKAVGVSWDGSRFVAGNASVTHGKLAGNASNGKVEGRSKKAEVDAEKKTDTGTAPRSLFAPPSLEEIKAYCLERRSRVDPQAWRDHYESNGWRVGRNPMKSWKAAVRTWERMDMGPVRNGNGHSPQAQPPVRLSPAQEREQMDAQERKDRWLDEQAALRKSRA